jgi:hypothetical protein
VLRVYSASSLKQQSIGRPVASLGHIILQLFFTVDNTSLYLTTFEKGRSNFINAVQVPVCKLTVTFLYQFVNITTNVVISNITQAIQHYVIQFVSDLRRVGGFLWVLRFSSNNKTDRHNISEILLKVALNTIPVCLLDTGFKYLLTFHRYTLHVCSLVFDILTTNRERKKWR